LPFSLCREGPVPPPPAQVFFRRPRPPPSPPAQSPFFNTQRSPPQPPLGGLTRSLGKKGVPMLTKPNPNRVPPPPKVKQTVFVFWETGPRGRGPLVPNNRLFPPKRPLYIKWWKKAAPPRGVDRLPPPNGPICFYYGPPPPSLGERIQYTLPE